MPESMSFKAVYGGATQWQWEKIINILNRLEYLTFYGIYACSLIVGHGIDFKTNRFVTKISIYPEN